MDRDHLKEKIKIFTEWLRGFFVLFVLGITAIATLIIRQKFLKSDFEYDLLRLTFLLDVIIFVIIIVVNVFIFRLIKSLKQ